MYINNVPSTLVTIILCTRKYVVCVFKVQCTLINSSFTVIIIAGSSDIV